MKHTPKHTPVLGLDYVDYEYETSATGSLTLSQVTFDPTKFKHIQSIPGQFASLKITSRGMMIAAVNTKPHGLENHYEITILSKRESNIPQYYSKKNNPETTLYEEIDKKSFQVDNFTENPFMFSVYRKSEFVVVCGERGIPRSYRLWKFIYNPKGRSDERFKVKKFDFETEVEINCKHFKLRLTEGNVGGFVDRKGRVVYPDVGGDERSEDSHENTRGSKYSSRGRDRVGRDGGFGYMKKFRNETKNYFTHDY